MRLARSIAAISPVRDLNLSYRAGRPNQRISGNPKRPAGNMGKRHSGCCSAGPTERWLWRWVCVRRSVSDMRQQSNRQRTAPSARRQNVLRVHDRSANSCVSLRSFIPRNRETGQAAAQTVPSSSKTAQAGNFERACEQSSRLGLPPCARRRTSDSG